jgi:CRP-like cAMP-binding protein
MIPVICDTSHFLERFPWLSDLLDVRAMQEGLLSSRFDSDEDLLDKRSPSPGAYLIRSGFACRYNVFPNGQRQIIGFLLPGDFCDSRATLFDRVEYSIAAMCRVEAVLIATGTLTDRLGDSLLFQQALCQVMAAEEAIDRQWLLNIGHRMALERVSHLLCEIHARLEMVGLTQYNICDLPLSQTDIADATALTPVHVNRMLMELRRRGIISLRRHRLAIHDLETLQRLGGFSRDYLAPFERPAIRQPTPRTLNGDSTREHATSSCA